MAQVYAFNEIEAIRSFKAALAQDPDCAQCAWGVAYQMGPNINDTERHDLREALRYVDYAVKHSVGSSAHDRALIDALAVRYGTDRGARAPPSRSRRKSAARPRQNGRSNRHRVCPSHA